VNAIGIKRFFKVTLTTLLVLASSEVFAEWVKVGGGNPNSDLYVDSSTIRKNGNMVKMWDMTDFKSTRVGGGLSYLSIKTQHEFDCKDQKARILSFTWYSKNKGNGAAAHTDNQAFEWETIPAETARAALWKVACGKL